MQKHSGTLLPSLGTRSPGAAAAAAQPRSHKTAGCPQPASGQALAAEAIPPAGADHGKRRFAALWRERRFHTIFYGRIRALERNKLTKKTLELAQQYFLPPYAFQIRVGALYLLYGLYSTQLCQPKQKIRIALKDWPEIQRFQQDLIDSQHYDAAYIFRTLRLSRAFHFTAMPKLLNYRTKKKIQENEFKEEFKDPSNRVNSLITNDVLEELMNIHDHYQKMKCVISADKSQPDKALSLIKDEFVVTLKDITLEHQEWQQNRMKLFLNAKETDEISNKKEEEILLESEGSERANALARIKYRSYSAVVEASKSRRHRQVKLESSESGSNYGKSPNRSKKNSRRPQPARRRDSLEVKGEMQVAKETVSRHIGMPIITEEDNSDEEVSLPKRKRRC
ncbi:PREDICTED: snRNA-activating protein complex subunit 1 [Aptenodytes forsteri]|uniref:snRNA-activating protein complex subunit 1 n=1 Tax=Aptenodytes forsteri TaxID=9233 RepID=UPI000904A4B9|nr:PREDICTED: snRNA-activating protein complex subunit 1 [Aptenodytes forsteri]